MRRLLLSALLGIFFFTLSTSVLARSGCCSWHNGVCGCSQTGRQVCCDGTLSPSCICYPPPPPIQPTPILIPSTLQGGSTYHFNNSTQSYNVVFNWDDWSKSSGWSIAISQYAGADPGPNMDTTSSIWTFKNIYPGRKYINMKASVNNYWSRVSYWTIDVPPFPTATPIPTITSTPTKTIILKPTKIVKKTIKRQSFLEWLFNK